MADRWVLSRAGIVNVYQYGDEILHFAGGRLLLRGVNGSGKSTAMNMLLPFLLDADTRRIDAAGEQSGVLRSWMLSGRDEQQPVGYLWLELRRGADHVTCGCGIKANRSTDRVTTWWFLTDRRPGIDLALVENRTPLGADALRATLGAGAVFAHDQRGAYRDQVRQRLYGGADLDQHIRLLHVVRNPRVGDRIDLDLPTYLEDALPQLSETALDDAAQPLEDLEEHRRNVEDLTRTVTALDALDTVYRGYARAELHRRAGEARRLVDEHRRRQAHESRARQLLADADAERDRARHAVDGLEGDEQRLRAEIDALTASDAYREGAELTNLRDHVAFLAKQLDGALREVAQRAGRRTAAHGAVVRASAQTDDDLVTLRHELDDLIGLAVAAGLTARVPDAPAVETRPARTGDAVRPVAPLEVEPLRRRLADVRASAHSRSGDVGEVRTALDAVDRAAARLADAERDLAAATEGQRNAGAAFVQAREVVDQVVQTWRNDITAWVAALDQHRVTAGLPATEPARLSVLATADLAGGRDEVEATLLDAAQSILDHHQTLAAALRARRDTEQQHADDLADQLDELRRRTLPDPPAAGWQRGDRGAALAELIDFRSDLDAVTRAGLEAAMEAAGLLGAEVSPDGGLTLADGQLVARPGKPADQPLSALLTVTIPDAVAGTVEALLVERVLDAISTSPDDLTGDRDTTVVTVDGRFRSGIQHGCHAKGQAEHIGLTARRAALERQRAHVATELDDARAVVARTQAELAHRTGLIDEVTRLRADRPSPTPVAEAVMRAESAEHRLDEARELRRSRTDEQRTAEAAHADSVDTAYRVASSLSLPPERSELDAVEQAVHDATSRCDQVDAAARALARSVDHWIGRADELDRADDDHAASQASHRELAHSHESESARLATLEDAIGLEYDEVVATIELSTKDLDKVKGALTAARDAHTNAHGQVERLTSEHETAQQASHAAAARCVDQLPALRAALAVPGLVASALAGEPPTGEAMAGEMLAGETPGSVADTTAVDTSTGVAGGSPADGDASPELVALPAVAETADGLRELAETVTARIPPPQETETTADGVRQSLRQRRDALGAGWDTEDRQPDPSLPLYIEVVGPLGRMPLSDGRARAHSQLRNMSSLLSAKQDQALRNLLQGLIAREVAHKLHAARELVGRMNARLGTIATSQGIGVSLRWNRRDDLDPALADTIGLLAKPPDLRTPDEDRHLTTALAARIADARCDDPEAPYRDLIAHVLDYRTWHRMALFLRRPGRQHERITRRTALSEGEKKMVSYLPLFAAVAASCDGLAESDRAAPRFVLLDDAFAKVSEDNHAKLFGLLVELDLDFIATSERLWGTHATIPELAVTEVIRDPDLRVIVLEHSRWDGHERTPAA
jgi:energy-coupling factor transporter ATP-binding protein EcfA2